MHQELLVADILKLLISSTVALTVLLAASIFQTVIVIVAIKILENLFLNKKFSFKNGFLEALCKSTPLGRRNVEKLKNGAVGMLYGGGGDCNLSYLIFSRLTIFKFRNCPLQNWVVHLKKNYFFMPSQFYENRSF